MTLRGTMSLPAILIVDDDFDGSESLKFMIEEEGYQVSLASSGEKALEIFSPGIFSLVILDLKMPGMGGVQTLEKLRQVDAKVKVIISTGNTFGEDLEMVQKYWE